MESYMNYTCSYKNQHILEHAKVLPCGFLVCLNCLKNIHANNLVCPCCAQLHKMVSPETLPTAKEVNHEIRNNFKDFTNELYNKLKQNIKLNENDSLVGDDCIENYFNYMSDELLLRTESLKIQLEDLYEKTQKIIEKTKEQVKMQFNKAINGRLELAREYIKNFDLKKTTMKIQDMHTLNRFLVYYTTNKLDLHESLKKISYIPSEIKLSANVLGTFKNITGLDTPVDQFNFEKERENIRNQLMRSVNVSIDNTFDFNEYYGIGRVVSRSRSGRSGYIENGYNNGSIFFLQSNVIDDQHAHINELVIFNIVVFGKRKEAVNIRKLSRFYQVSYT